MSTRQLDELFYLCRRSIYNFRWIFFRLSWLFVKRKRFEFLRDADFSIGIVTYVDRYDRFFKGLIKKLVTIFPDTEIVIAINGYHDQSIQKDYLEKINGYLSGFPRVKIVQFHEPQSLSRLWNLLILNSSNKKTLILNDDINIAPFFRSNIYSSGILNEDIALINLSWSHFLISKATVKKIGWFDERFPAVGNEDQDYECRLVLEGIQVKSYRNPGLRNVVFKTKNFSWKDTTVVNKKYVKANELFFNSKWETSVLPLDGFVYVRILEQFVRLKPGMSTPQFYTKELV